MSLYLNKENLEVGVDEVARGCLAGPVYAAAVIWPNSQEYLEDIKLDDSKKLSKKRREYLKEYIEEHAIDFGIGYATNEEIDKLNIRKATSLAMKRALDNLTVIPDMILVDGNYFEPYVKNTELIPSECFIKGDSKFQSISAASILAKVYHDNFITDLCHKNKEFIEYGWLNNMCYGTEEHIKAIKKYGITKYHRKTFGICKNNSVK